ncbi:MAG TPA: hypothetical protein VJU16_06530 [Planctomycetota bacterium]|nr:hypothetical protein [Planctomycetota bacterium]
MKFATFTRVIWGIGVILVILSWTDVVPRTAGWIGFGLACLGILLGEVFRRRM